MGGLPKALKSCICLPPTSWCVVSSNFKCREILIFLKDFPSIPWHFGDFRTWPWWRKTLIIPIICLCLATSCTCDPARLSRNTSQSYWRCVVWKKLLANYNCIVKGMKKINLTGWHTKGIEIKVSMQTGGMSFEALRAYLCRFGIHSAPQGYWIVDWWLDRASSYPACHELYNS